MKLTTTLPNMLLLIFVVLFQSCAQNDHGLVRNLAELDAAVKNAVPGSVITMANGVWKDVELVVEGEGEEGNPIMLTVEEKGKVFIEGQSNLKISGNYIIVDGLVFRNGFTPSTEVISFRTNKQILANNSQVTNCVIDDYNNPERFEADYWVTIYGKNNRFDYNTLVNKRNQGVTLAVRMNTEESRENGHIIENNYFGPRPNLGSNGGETLRIGTSHYSRLYSNTIISNNYFDRCDGEHEIISNKACGNIYDSNVFFECRGTLTMRHGHHTLVKNNFFFGNRKMNTGGIRVINEYQTVKNNYASGLTGYRFRGALVIMNGVPNSPINRYNQVIDSEVSGNVFIDCDHIQLCAGSDEERSATPQGVDVSNNIFFSETNPNLFTVYDDISGINFTNNILNSGIKAPVEPGFVFDQFVVEENEHGLKMPPSNLLQKIGYAEGKKPMTIEDVGAPYYNKDFNEVLFKSGKIIEVPQGINTLLDALKGSNPGDILQLEANGEYVLSKDFNIYHPLTIKGDESSKPIIKSLKTAFFRIENGGALELENLIIDGEESPDQPGNSVISTSRYSMTHNYNLFVKNCDTRNLLVNHTFDFFKVYKNTFADTVLIEYSTFKDITGSVLAFDKEFEDLGIYNVEHLLVNKSSFENIEGAVLNVYRGGSDESTFGPIITVLESVFTNIGFGKRNRSKASLKFHGVQNLLVKDSKWLNSAPVKLFLTNGEPITNIRNCEFVNTGKIMANNTAYSSKNIDYIKE